MVYYLKQSQWLNSNAIPEGMNLDMLNDSERLDVLTLTLKTKALNNVVIDLGAGTGALGLLALAHGAKFVYFVEQDPQMNYILENVIPKKAERSKFKIIKKDIQSLEISDFDFGIPDLVVSEFFGPRLFDEGYVPYTKHIRALFPNCYFIPEKYVVEFYLTDVDYSQPIWPVESNLIDHFKFMYKEKGFSKIFPFKSKKHMGTMIFNANQQTFNNNLEFVYENNEDNLLVGHAIIQHDEIKYSYIVLGWLMTADECGKNFRIHFQEDNYYNPVKINLSNETI